jgi:hypothetical protein
MQGFGSVQIMADPDPGSPKTYGSTTLRYINTRLGRPCYHVMYRKHVAIKLEICKSIKNVMDSDKKNHSESSF